jgi:hypothetical protein
MMPAPTNRASEPRANMETAGPPVAGRADTDADALALA